MSSGLRLFMAVWRRVPLKVPTAWWKTSATKESRCPTAMKLKFLNILFRYMMVKTIACPLVVGGMLRWYCWECYGLLDMISDDPKWVWLFLLFCLFSATWDFIWVGFLYGECFYVVIPCKITCFQCWMKFSNSCMKRLSCMCDVMYLGGVFFFRSRACLWVYSVS